MRFLKASTLSRKNVKDDTLAVDIDKQILMDSNNVLLMPKGSTSNRPGEVGAATASPVNGHIRYNTTTNEVEVYQNSAWRNIRFKEASSITQQTVGTGDDTETVFGPLSPTPSATQQAQNYIVLIENVVQLSTTNYTLEQSVSGSLTGPNAPYANGYYIKFSSAVPTGKPVTVLHGFDL
jgi:hypothetical protein